jgi:hypothetical protein
LITYSHKKNCKLYSLFSGLLSISNWFEEWRTSVLTKNFFSKECSEDFANVLCTYPEVCKLHLERFPQSALVPARFNSDIVENFFCQVRGLFNGQKTNPTVMDYRSTINSWDKH